MAKCPHLEERVDEMGIEPYCDICDNRVLDQKYQDFCDAERYASCAYYQKQG